MIAPGCAILSLCLMAADIGGTVAVTDSIGEVVVTGTRNATDIRHLSQTVNVVSREIISQSRNSSFLPLLNEQVPGLFVTSRGIMGYGVSMGSAGAISLRGISGGASRLLVLVDGHPQYAGIFGHPVADMYHSASAEKIEVLKGPASLLYGSGAMGGVVNLVTREKREDGVATDIRLGYGLYNTVETEISNSVKKGAFNSFISGFYDRTDGHRANMGFSRYGGRVSLAYAVTPRWKISGDFDIAHFNAEQPGPVDSLLYDAWQKVTRGTAALFIENDYGKTSGAINLFGNLGHHRINDGHTESTAPKPYLFISDDDMLGASAYQSTEFFRGNRTTFGIDFTTYGGGAVNQYVSGPKSGKEEIQVERREYELAGYFDFRQQFAGIVTLNAGLRVDHHFSCGTEWIPQAGLSFRLPYSAGLKLSASKGFRYPTIRERHMYPTQNPDLKPESMWNYEVAFSQKPLDGRITYGVNLFVIDAKNIILSLPNPSGAGLLNMNSGRLLNSGVEAEFVWHITPIWAVNTNYSYLYMKYPVISSPEHKLNVGGSFTKGRWHVSTGLQYVNGLYTSVTPVKKENFFLWNLRFAVRATKWLEVWINGDNLTNSRYEILEGYPMPGASFIAGLDFHF